MLDLLPCFEFLIGKDDVLQVRYGQVLEGGQVETKKLAKHRGRAHKLAVEPGSSRIFYSCGEDGVVRQVRVLLAVYISNGKFFFPPFLHHFCTFVLSLLIFVLFLSLSFVVFVPV